MRTIKFRGKDIGTGEWFFGNLFDKDRCGRTHICTTRKGCLNIDPSTVGQFTGLLDNNGNEIYEGDILMFREEENGNDTLVVMWDKGSFVAEYPNRGEGACIRSNYFAAFPQMFRVVGNIRDTPELLKGGAE